MDKLHQSKCPVLVIHGDADEVISIFNGKELHLSIPEEHRYEPLWVPGAGHTNLEPTAGELYYEHLQKFIKHITTKE